jgi:hypothetical protein
MLLYHWGKAGNTGGVKGYFRRCVLGQKTGGIMKAFWTVQEVDILRKMVEAGKSVNDIRMVLTARSNNAIRCKVNDIGMVFRGTPEIDFEAFKQIMQTAR